MQECSDAVPFAPAGQQALLRSLLRTCPERSYQAHYKARQQSSVLQYINHMDGCIGGGVITCPCFACGHAGPGHHMQLIL